MIIAATLAIAPSLAIAESQVERLERLSEAKGDIMVEMMASGIEAEGGDGTLVRAVAGNVPEWDDEMRTAAGCVLDRYADYVRDSAIEASLDRMEELMSDAESFTFEAMEDEGFADSMLPEGITIDQAGEISGECGMMALQMRDMQASGLWSAMMEASETIPDS